jgi:hypothetical protein
MTMIVICLTDNSDSYNCACGFHDRARRYKSVVVCRSIFGGSIMLPQLCVQNIANSFAGQRLQRN